MHNVLMESMLLDCMLMDYMLMSVLVEQSQSLQLKVLPVLFLKVTNVLVLESKLLLEVMLVHALKSELLLMLDVQVVLILVEQLNISCCGNRMVMHRVHWVHISVVLMRTCMMSLGGLLTRGA